MQLLASHIGPDRVSDIAANVLKQFLIEYTQRQAEFWQIPLRAGIPIEHVYDHSPCELFVFAKRLLSLIDMSIPLYAPLK